MYESWLSWCAREFRGKFTKLRALELVEFRNRLILDLGIIVIRATGIEKKFMGETLAACFRANRDSCVNSPRRFDAQPYQEGGMIARIDAGVMLLTPSEHDFTRMQHDYALETEEATCPSVIECNRRAKLGCIDVSVPSTVSLPFQPCLQCAHLQGDRWGDRRPRSRRRARANEVRSWPGLAAVSSRCAGLPGNRESYR